MFILFITCDISNNDDYNNSYNDHDDGSGGDDYHENHQ